MGCGNGVPATRELAEKHRVLGLDISSEQIARATSNVRNATFICADVREVGLPAESFDAIVALYLIDNVPCEDYPALFRKLAGLLGRRWPPAVERRTRQRSGTDVCFWLGVPMFINAIPTEQLIGLLLEAGLHIASTEIESQLEGGRPIEFAWIVVEKE